METIELKHADHPRSTHQMRDTMIEAKEADSFDMHRMGKKQEFRVSGIDTLVEKHGTGLTKSM